MLGDALGDADLVTRERLRVRGVRVPTLGVLEEEPDEGVQHRLALAVLRWGGYEGFDLLACLDALEEVEEGLQVLGGLPVGALGDERAEVSGGVS